MTLVHKAGNIHKNADGFGIWAFPNASDNHAYVPTSAEPQILIEGIKIRDVGTGFFQEVRESYKQDKLYLAYKTSIQASTGKPPAIYKLLDDKVRHNANQRVNYAFEYAKQNWDKGHKTKEFKAGDLILVSTLSFNNIKGQNKLKDSFSGPFIIKALHGTNAVQVQLSGEVEKNPIFPISLVKNYSSSDKELFPLRNETPIEVPPLYQSEEKNVLKVLKERRLRGKNEREYLVRYRNPQHEDEWITESKIPDSQKFLRRFRHERRPIRQ
ncbi:hypothetical protein O181_090505 [Austropuccinia psidii MF-1]|uniref:Chromo domain-containing protein n=1 Tax=Austropuccinia psidii MF-1 TaxID=1389203 RepID=A0A9Q3P756_9BASI|nr:hypothetical protein [Austropuccinia psidii MF-1]